MEKRVLVTILLSMAVMFGYSFLVTPTAVKKQVAKNEVVQKQVTSQILPAAPVAAAPQPASPPAMISAGVKDVTVDTELFKAVFSTQGAALKKFVLKKYRTGTARDAGFITLIDEEAPDNYSLKIYGSGIEIDPYAVYSVDKEALEVKKGEEKTLEFETKTSNGTTLRKKFTFSGDSYTIGLEAMVGNSGTGKREGAIQLIEKNRYVKAEKEASYDVHGPTTFADDSLHTQKMADLEKGATDYNKNVLWSGFENKYFLSAVVADKGSIAAVKVRQENGYVENIVSTPRVALEPGGSAAFDYRLYFGPKDLDILKSQGSRLEEVIDFGWFSAIAKPLLYALKFFYRFVGNYGVCIIIITVILKLLFYPLTNKSYKSMKEMQKLQPKMEALKEKYKNDRDAMNRAVMDLYKTHKVNPMGGCLPMLVQIPVFFALYKALLFSIELRHAPFMLWLKDLSAPDALFGTLPAGLPILAGMPIGPLPLLMGATMVIQQKMTPSNMDPMQAKMMMALPFVFTFMFLNFPSGLVLYWLVNNILTIAQQYYINKSMS